MQEKQWVVHSKLKILEISNKLCSSSLNFSITSFLWVASEHFRHLYRLKNFIVHYRCGEKIHPETTFWRCSWVGIVRKESTTGMETERAADMAKTSFQSWTENNKTQLSGFKYDAATYKHICTNWKPLRLHPALSKADSCMHPINMHSLQRSESLNLALGKEHGWKTVGHTWREHLSGEVVSGHISNNEGRWFEPVRGASVTQL